MVRKNQNNPSTKIADSLVDEYSGYVSLVNTTHMKKRTNSKGLYLVYIALASVVLGFTPLFLFFNSGFSWTQSVNKTEASDSNTNLNSGLCLSVQNGTLCCDRTSVRSDICVMKGDVRTDPAYSSLILYTSHDMIKSEKIRPYTRKWEPHVMNTVTELDLIVNPNSGNNHHCDVHHRVPAVFFSTAGYTGNLYHEFNDGILPLYITSQQMNKKVVFVILDYHDWWMSKYSDVISQLTDFPIIDFNDNQIVHCFPEAVIGLRIHGELTIDPGLIVNRKTIVDFHDLLGKAYLPRIETLTHERLNSSKPKLVIISRTGSRSITNQDLLVKMANDIGFEVDVLIPKRDTELARIYHILNSSDAVIGVHGAAMTHLIFMKPGSVLIQVIPLGTDWAAEAYYGEPAKKMRLKYIGYKVVPSETSLYYKYGKNDPILTDPTSINSKGWEFTKKIYLDDQTLKLKLHRFRKRLVRAYEYCYQRSKIEVNVSKFDIH